MLGKFGLAVPSTAAVKSAVKTYGVATLGFAGANIAWGYAWDAVGGYIPGVDVHPAVKPAIRTLVGIVVTPMAAKAAGKYGREVGMGVGMALIGGGILGVVKAFAGDVVPATATVLGDSDTFLLEGAPLAVSDLNGLGAAAMMVQPGLNPIAALG